VTEYVILSYFEDKSLPAISFALVLTLLLLHLQVSAWGGYVFIINLIPLHVFVLLLMGRYSNRIFVGKHTYI